MYMSSALLTSGKKTLISMVKVEYCGLHWLSPIYPYYVPNIHTSSIYMSVVGYISPLYLSLISRCVWHSPGPSAAAGASHLAFPGSGHSGNIGFCHYWIRWDAVRLVELMVQGHWDLLCSFSGRCRGELARASRASCIFGKHETPVAFLSFPDIFVDTKRYSATLQMMRIHLLDCHSWATHQHVRCHSRLGCTAWVIDLPLIYLPSVRNMS